MKILSDENCLIYRELSIPKKKKTLPSISFHERENCIAMPDLACFASAILFCSISFLL